MSSELRPCPACGGEECTEIDYWLVAKREERGRRVCLCGAASPWVVTSDKEDRGQADIDAAYNALPRREDAAELAEALEFVARLKHVDDIVHDVVRAALAKWGK